MDRRGTSGARSLAIICYRKKERNQTSYSLLTQCNRAGITICRYLTVIAQGYDRCAELRNKQLSIEAKTDILLGYLRDSNAAAHSADSDIF